MDRRAINRSDRDERVQGIKQCREDSKRTRSATSFVPLDVVARVLLRLPAKSIGRCRCVCREWRSLTRDARFIDEHRRWGGATAGPRLVASDALRGKTKIERLSIYELGPTREEIKHRFVHIKFDEPAGSDFYSSSNPADGLISVIGITKSDIFLLNPTTGEISQLPRQLNMVDGWCSMGLGFDASRGEYKMVTFSSDSCMVLTVGTGAWRHIGVAPCQVFSIPCFLHGTIYWLADELHRLGIFAFDVKHETFQFIPAPTFITSDHNPTNSLHLHNLEGHICIVEVSRLVPAARIFMWILTDSHEWKLQYDIDISFLLDQTVGYSVIELLVILDGQVLIRWHDAVYSYDLHGKTMRTISCSDFSHHSGVFTDFLHELCVVTESLVSPGDLIGTKSV